jgi:hypothetical protein
LRDGGRGGSGSADLQYLLVSYETLIGEPEREVARICERLGEEYSPSMLDATEPAVSRPHVPWMERAWEAVTTGRLERWRQELTAEEASQIEWAVGDHLEAFGYQHAGGAGLAPRGLPAAWLLPRGTASARGWNNCHPPGAT